MSTCTGFDVACYFKQAFVWLLLQIRNFIYLIIASPAAAAFVWAVNPENVSGPKGVLNLPAIYQLWQFIRDFFNLFFILILLFSAFATIFQVDSFNIRNIFKNVLLVALLINFSFPITRFLIDATNVPMYYLINDVIGNGTGRGGMIAMNNALAYSGISSGVMSVTGDNSNIVPVLMSIVFAFLFGISLAVLAVMMIIRLVALTLLLIFSPIGFASALLPGLSKYGQEWWSKFWSYALFGPAAALMLVVSLKFLEASGALFRSMQMVGTDITPGTGEATIVSQAIFFTIPIMLIWFTIGLANKFSLAGAATVVGAGYGAVHWTRKKVQRGMWVGTKAVTRQVLPVDHARGALSGVSHAFKEDGRLFGKKIIPNFLIQKKVKENRERYQTEGKAWIRGGKKDVQKELEKIARSRAYTRAEEMKKNNEDDASLQRKMEEGTVNKQTGEFDFKDPIEAAAAAMVLADRKAIKTTEDFTRALTALGNNTTEINKLIEKASVGAVKGLSPAQYRAIMTSGPVSRESRLRDTFNDRIVNEGGAKLMVDYELHKATGGTREATEAEKQTAVQTVTKDLRGAKDIAKQQTLFQAYSDVARKEMESRNFTTEQILAIQKASAEEGTEVGRALQRVATGRGPQSSARVVPPGGGINTDGLSLQPKDSSEIPPKTNA